jgi:hypothetical protein
MGALDASFWRGKRGGAASASGQSACARSRSVRPLCGVPSWLRPTLGRHTFPTMSHVRVLLPGRTGVVLLGAVLVLSGCVFSQTGDPHVVTDDTALLTGTLQSTQAEHTEYWFEYSVTTDYGTETAHTAIDLVAGANPVSVHVDGLTAATTYHYRLCNDVPGSATNAPFCGADQSVTTGSGRVSVQGAGTRHGELFPLLFSFSQSISAAADPGGIGYVDGTVNDNSVATFGGSPGGTVGVTTGRGVVVCLRVRGNVAVAGYTASYVTVGPNGSTTAQGSRLFIVQDKGPNHDRYVVTSWTPTDGCPEPNSALLGTATDDTADFVVRGG